MAMEEEDIEKTMFHTGSSGLYKFTRMNFGLINVGASFCRLMEMCIGDQQYVTLLFYLDNICIFAETADQMLHHIELMFSHLKEFNLKIKPKKWHFFQTSVTFLGHILSADGISPNLEKVAKIKDWPIPKIPKEVHSFVGLASYYRRFIPNFAKWAGPLHALIIPASFKQKIRKGEMKKSNLPEFQWTLACQEGLTNSKKLSWKLPYWRIRITRNRLFWKQMHHSRVWARSYLKKGMTMKYVLLLMPVDLFYLRKNPCGITVWLKSSSWL